MRTLVILIYLLFLLSCNSVNSSAKTQADKFRNEKVYRDSSVLGRVINHYWEIPLFKGFDLLSSGDFPAASDRNYSITQITKNNESYVLLSRFLKPPDFSQKLLDTLHFTNYDTSKFVFGYWYCTRDKKYGQDAFVGLFSKTKQRLLINPINAWEVDTSKGIFVKTSPAGITCQQYEL